MILRGHHQLLAGSKLNAIDQWFAGGGLGHYWHVEPAYCFTDEAATTNAAVGDAVARIDDRSGSKVYLRNSTLSQRPTLQYDSTLGRYYLQFTAASSQRLSSDATTAASDWKWLHDGTEWLSVALAQFGDVSNPNAFYTLWATNQGSQGNIGTCLGYDDRSSQSRNDAGFVLIARAVNGTPVTQLATSNILTPNTPQVHSLAYANGYAGNDADFRVAGSSSMGGETAAAPSNLAPTGRFTLGCMVNATLPMQGRVYAQALIRGSGARSGVSSYEAVI